MWHLTEGGIPGLRQILYGLHLCHFYSRREELAEIPRALLPLRPAQPRALHLDRRRAVSLRRGARRARPADAGLRPAVRPRPSADHRRRALAREPGRRAGGGGRDALAAGGRKRARGRLRRPARRRQHALRRARRLVRAHALRGRPQAMRSSAGASSRCAATTARVAVPLSSPRLSPLTTTCCTGPMAPGKFSRARWLVG